MTTSAWRTAAAAAGVRRAAVARPEPDHGQVPLRPRPPGHRHGRIARAPLLDDQHDRARPAGGGEGGRFGHRRRPDRRLDDPARVRDGHRRQDVGRRRPGAARRARRPTRRWPVRRPSGRPWRRTPRHRRRAPPRQVSRWPGGAAPPGPPRCSTRRPAPATSAASTTSPAPGSTSRSVTTTWRVAAPDLRRTSLQDDRSDREVRPGLGGSGQAARAGSMATAGGGAVEPGPGHGGDVAGRGEAGQRRRGRAGRRRRWRSSPPAGRRGGRRPPGRGRWRRPGARR